MSTHTDEKTTFKAAYQTLSKHAETLRSQSEPNIDDLLTIIDESVAGYQAYQDRIDAVEQALSQALAGGVTQARAAS